jgi:hypothetical protein
VMGAARTGEHASVDAEMPVADLISRLSGAESCFDVTDGGAVIGAVTAQTIVERLKG